MKRSRQVALQFKDADAFAKFCLSLGRADVLFDHAGFKTVVLSSTYILELSPEVAQLLKRFKGAGLVEEYEVPLRGKRHLPKPEEARERLRAFTKML